jgi:hypothetical protein
MNIIQNIFTSRNWSEFSSQIFLFIVLSGSFFFSACSTDPKEVKWDYKIDFGDEIAAGVMKIEPADNNMSVTMFSYDWGTLEFEQVVFENDKLSGVHDRFELEGTFAKEEFKGKISTEEGNFTIVASRQSEKKYTIDRSHVAYLLPESDLSPTEKNIDHTGIIEDWDRQAFRRGARIYNSNCINCHGTPEIEGSIPMSQKFWAKPFKAGSDPYSMYQTLSRGFGAMPPQLTLTPKEKYDVILYVQENFVRESNEDQYVSTSPGYLAGLPEGISKGPDAKPYHPWSDMNYGNFFINTYELVDEETGPKRYHSPGPVPYADEDYSKNNFAYKGIAMRLDKGPGGISKGNAWMIFDHDLMRVAGGWTGDGFIDWNGILLNDKHETYPRTIGKLHFETPVGPGWANPLTGSYEDPRFRARDGRAFGPLPKNWANFKGLYHHGENIVISYSIGASDILEQLGMERFEEEVIFTRTLNVSASNSKMEMRVAPKSYMVAIKAEGATLSKKNGFYVLDIPKSTNALVKLFITDSTINDFDKFVDNFSGPESLMQYTHGGPAHYPDEITSQITIGHEESLFAIDWLMPPFDNPWDCRMKLSGIDFLNDANRAVACATDGDVWMITGLTENKGTLTWQRIGAGLFQPLGIKVLEEEIYVICRDQLVRLRDLNGDHETDFYESFNHDHQVTDHFHEFAMGLQADKQGNLYYAKSGRHARESLIPQHGTLLKVSKDGSKTDIIATGFRAANGVCLNPDGSFIVTDQQGFWNPMNRVNWVQGNGNFYGNMWGYDPPNDTTRAAMEPPMVWIDMEFDRSPSEMLWVDSEKWGPLNGGLLSFSYGYGKIQLVLPEKVMGQMQGGVIDLPGVKFLTGVMRGRFNQEDGHLYACGMSAWGTTQMMKGGGLYRLRYTGKPLTLPVQLKAWETGIVLGFASKLEMESAQDINNYEVKTWDIVRSSKYGSDRYNIQELKVLKSIMQSNGKSVKLLIEDIEPVDIMTIKYNIKDTEGNQLQGTVQNTIHNLPKEPGA